MPTFTFPNVLNTLYTRITAFITQMRQPCTMKTDIHRVDDSRAIRFFPPFFPRYRPMDFCSPEWAKKLVITVAWSRRDTGPAALTENCN